MNKSEFIAAVAEKANVTKKDAEACVNAVLATTTETLQKGESIAFVGFGSFSTVKRDAREARNPQGGTVKVPAKNVVKFKAGASLKEAINTKPAKAKKK